MTERHTQGFQSFRPPPLPGWVWRGAAALAVVYALELTLTHSLGIDPSPLALWPVGDPRFHWWQPASRLVVQGDDVVRFLFAVVVLAWAGPALARRRGSAWAPMAAAWAGMSAGALLLGAAGARPPDLGFGPLATGAVTLLALEYPDGSRRLGDTPIRRTWLLAGLAAILLLPLLAAPSMAGGGGAGAAAGVAGWWWLGPRRRRARLLEAGRGIESQVLPFDPSRRRDRGGRR